MTPQMQLTIPLPGDVESDTDSTLRIKGESETYYGTEFDYIICFSKAALEKIEDPPGGGLSPSIKPLRFKVDKRYKVLAADVGADKIEFVKKPEKPGKLTIKVRNKLVELEELIHQARLL